MFWGVSLQKISLFNLLVLYSGAVKIFIFLYLSFLIFLGYDKEQHNARDLEVRDSVLKAMCGS